MLEAKVFDSIEAIGRERWETCAQGALEGYDYLAAVEGAGMAGFQWRYVLVEEGGRPLAVAPGFISDYRLDTTLSEFGRSMVAAARRLAPRAFTVKMACLGSPCTEDVSLAFAPEAPAERRPEILRRLLDAFQGEAADANCSLMAIKDAPERQAALWGEAAERAGYQPTPGLPTAILPIAFPDLDGYLATLSAGTRKDMRRKLKSLEKLRIEVVQDVAGLEDRILQLYRETRARSDLQFEELTAAYFTGVLRRMGERALCVLYWAGEALIGFNLLLQGGGNLLDKFFCMESERGPAFNLYFVSWFVNVRLCIERGLKTYQSGQAGYDNKLRLGSHMIGAQMYFRHRQPLVNRALQWVAPLLADEQLPQRGAA